MAKIKSKITPNIIKEFRSYAQIQQPGPKFCQGCGKECEDGQILWNGWFCREGQYHLKCVPSDLRRKFNLPDAKK